MKTKTTKSQQIAPPEIARFPERPEALPIKEWGDVFRAAASTSHVRFHMNLEKDLYRALLTEATAHGLNLFQIANEMIRLGLDRFVGESREWSYSTTPLNVLPLPAPIEGIIAAR